jgi:hypothetical protein
VTSIKLKPCPFCGGPPVPIVQNYVGGGAAPLLEDYGDGLMVRAFVFCHECGADGPNATPLIYDAIEYRLAELEAIHLWQQRDMRHLCLYEGGEADGLNLYPRPVKETA